MNLKIRASLIAAVVSLLLAHPASAASVSIGSPLSGSTVSASEFTISGSATAHSKITISINGANVGETTSDSSGNWSLAVSGQAAGAKTINVTASKQQLLVNVLNAADFSASRMSRINTLTNNQESSFSIFGGGAFPITWKPNPAFTKAHGVAPYLNSPTVWSMDLVTGSVTTFNLPGTGQRGAAVAYNSDGSKVYITDNANTDVVVYNTINNTQVGSAIGVGNAPHSNTYRPNSNQVWVANSGDTTVSAISTLSDSVVNTFNTTGSPNGLAFSPDGSKAYVGVDTAGGGVDIMNAATGTVTSTLDGTGTPEVLLINSAGTKLYASLPLSNAVDVFNLSTGSLESTISVPNGPWGTALNADESRLYVTAPNLLASLSGTNISVVNTATNNVISTVTPGGGAPFFIFAAPPETATATATLTVTDASLAGTGEDARWLGLFCLAMLMGGLFTIGVALKACTPALLGLIK
jgi:DNA-binding beta-propeller fold protein YncE